MDSSCKKRGKRFREITSGGTGTIYSFCTYEELKNQKYTDANKMKRESCGHVEKEFRFASEEEEKKFKKEVKFMEHVALPANQKQLELKEQHKSRYPFLSEILPGTGCVSENRHTGSFVMKRYGCSLDRIINSLVKQSDPSFDEPSAYKEGDDSKEMNHEQEAIMARRKTERERRLLHGYHCIIFLLFCVVRTLDKFHLEVGYLHGDNSFNNFMFIMNQDDVFDELDRIYDDFSPLFHSFLEEDEEEKQTIEQKEEKEEKEQKEKEKKMFALCDRFMASTGMIMIDFEEVHGAEETRKKLLPRVWSDKQLFSLDYFIVLFRLFQILPDDFDYCPPETKEYKRPDHQQHERKKKKMMMRKGKSRLSKSALEQKVESAFAVFFQCLMARIDAGHVLQMRNKYKLNKFYKDQHRIRWEIWWYHIENVVQNKEISLGRHPTTLKRLVCFLRLHI